MAGTGCILARGAALITSDKILPLRPRVYFIYSIYSIINRGFLKSGGARHH